MFVARLSRLVLVLLVATLLGGCLGLETRKVELSDAYSLREVSGSPFWRAHQRIYTKDEGGRAVYLGSMMDSGWAGQWPLGLEGLSSRYLVVAEDGRSIVYVHNHHLAGRRSGKPSGIYRHVFGEGETLVREQGTYSIGASRWSKEVPRNLLFFGEGIHGDELAMGVDGKVFPLALLGAGPLHGLVYEGSDLASETEMLSAGDLDLLTHWGHPPLEVALVRGNEDAALRLLTAGADPEACSKPAVYIAARFGRLRALGTLLSEGLSPDVRSEAGNPALFAPLLMSRVDIDYDNIYGGGWNARPGFDTGRAALRLLIEGGADLDAREAEGRSCVHLAVSVTRSLELLEILIEAGADPDARDQDGDIPLHFASRSEERSLSRWEEGTKPILDLLLAGTEDIDTRNAEGLTPLQRAVQVNGIRSAEYLVAHGADDSLPYVWGRMGPKARSEETLRDRIEKINSSDFWAGRQD